MKPIRDFYKYYIVFVFHCAFFIKYKIFNIIFENIFIVLKKHIILWKMRFAMIERNHYLSKLISTKNNGFPKIITGIRRCGKSYLLKKSIP